MASEISSVFLGTKLLATLVDCVHERASLVTFNIDIALYFMKAESKLSVRQLLKLTAGNINIISVPYSDPGSKETSN